MKSLLAAAALTLALAGCQTGATLNVVSSDTVDRTYKRGASGSKDGASHVEVAAKVKERDGKVLLCVAVTGYGSSTFADEWPGAIAEALIIDLDDQRLVTGAAFAGIYTDERTTLGKMAQCALTSRVWRDKYRTISVEFRLPQVRLRA